MIKVFLQEFYRNDWCKTNDFRIVKATELLLKQTHTNSRIFFLTLDMY